MIQFDKLPPGKLSIEGWNRSPLHVKSQTCPDSSDRLYFKYARRSSIEHFIDDGRKIFIIDFPGIGTLRVSGILKRHGALQYVISDVELIAPI